MVGLSILHPLIKKLAAPTVSDTPENQLSCWPVTIDGAEMRFLFVTT